MLGIQGAHGLVLRFWGLGGLGVQELTGFRVWSLRVHTTLWLAMFQQDTMPFSPNAPKASTLEAILEPDPPTAPSCGSMS